MSVNFNNLNLAERKKMLDIFIKASKQPATEENKTSFKSSNGGFSDQNPPLRETISYAKKNIPNKGGAEPFSKMVLEEHSKASRFFLFLRAYFSGVTSNPFGTDFSESFMHMVTVSLQHHLNVLSKLANIILKCRFFTNIDSATKFFKDDPIALEILIRFSKLNVSNSMEAIKKTSIIRVVKEDYRKLLYDLYPLLSALTICEKAFETGFEKILESNHTKENIILQEKTIMVQSFEFINKNFFKNLNIATQVLFNYKASFMSLAMREILELTEASSLLGGMKEVVAKYLNQHQGLEEDSDEDSEDENTDSEISKEDYFIQKGYDFISNMPLEFYLNSENSLVIHVDKNDKIALLHAVLECLRDKSTFLLSKQTKFLSYIYEGVRCDVKDTIVEFQLEIDSFNRFVKDYDSIFYRTGDKNQFSKYNRETSYDKTVLSEKLKIQIKGILARFLDKMQVLMENVDQFLQDAQEAVPNVLTSRLEDALANQSDVVVNPYTTRALIFEESYTVLKALLDSLIKGDLSGTARKVVYSDTFRIYPEPEQDFNKEEPSKV